jgi:mannose-6-phosphate isomerase-like protein (cupin superfamily)
MGLFVEAKDVPTGKVSMKVEGGQLSTQQAVGKECSLMVARRSAGYHSKPHTHGCEQLNYVVRGTISIFVENEVYHLNTGDYLRIPADAVHWAWNRSDEECELIECHAPALDILPRDQVALLLDEGEDPSEVKWVENVFVSEEHMRVETELLG